MNKLIHRQNKSYYKFINTAAKRVACVIAAIGITASVTVMSVDALRNAFFYFLMETFEKFRLFVQLMILLHLKLLKTCMKSLMI